MQGPGFQARSLSARVGRIAGVDKEAPKIDPLFLNSRKEAAVILLAWLGCFLYTVVFCYLNGYLSHEPIPGSVGPDVADWFGPLQGFDRDPGSLTTPLGLGIPDWVLWGVIAPWLACLVLTFWFCFCYFKEDDLGEEFEGTRSGEDVS